MKRLKSASSQISRRKFVAISGAAAAVVVSPAFAQSSGQSTGPQGPPGQVPKFSKADLWVQLTTGGQSYPASFQEMFLDPMFLGMNIWPIDQPASFAALTPDAAAPTRPRPVVPGVRSALGGGTERLEPGDYPWEPSGGRAHPGYDVLVVNDQTNWADDQRKAIKRALETNRGVVVLHYALGDNQDWPWWYQEVTGGLLALSDLPGAKKSTVSGPVSLNLRPVGKHPILRNIDSFTVTNEQAFKGMWQSPKITPLLQTTSSASDSTVAWVGVNQKVVCIQMGSSRETHHNPAYRMLLRNSILWAAGRLV